MNALSRFWQADVASRLFVGLLTVITTKHHVARASPVGTLFTALAYVCARAWPVKVPRPISSCNVPQFTKN
jgi:hypothetical protein